MNYQTIKSAILQAQRPRAARHFCACLLALFVLFICTAAFAQGRPFSQLLDLWNRQLDRITTRMGQDLLPLEIDALRALASDVRSAASSAANIARNDFVATRTLLAPLEVRSPSAVEADGIRGEREKLTQMAAISEGRLRQCELVIARADQVISGLTQARTDAAFRLLFRRFDFLNSGEALDGMSAALIGAFKKTTTQISEWRIGSKTLNFKRGTRLQFTIWAIAAIVLWPVARAVRHFYLIRTAGKKTQFFRVVTTALDTVTSTVTPVLIILVTTWLLLATEPPYQLRDVVANLGQHILLASLALGLTSVALKPRTEGRILPLTDDGARHLARGLRRLILVAVPLHFITTALAYAASTSGSALLAIGGLLNATTITFLSLPVLYSRAWYAARPEASKLPPVVGGVWWSIGRVAVGILALLSLGFALFGYYALADHLIEAVFVTGLLVACSLLLHRLISDALSAAVSFDSSSGKWLRQRFGFAPNSKLNGYHVIILTFDVALAIGLIILIPIAWGADGDAVLRGLGQLFAGTRVGGVRISLKDVGVAIAAFGLCLTAVRLLRNVVRTRLLPTIDASVPLRQSVDAVLNYAGVTIAVLVGVAALGLDFTNLAIVIGALSVGIGLGLQNIANNVVSGVFLLVERPIKAGDWVAVVGHEGVVRRISIRATEIETLQRTHVFVPNSAFLQNPVINRTYLDTSSRLDIPVSVGLGVEIETVEELLCGVAIEHPDVMRDPAPSVRFLRVTPSGLDFELLVFVSRIEDRFIVSNALIKKVFKKLVEQRLVDPSQPIANPSIAERAPSAATASSI